MGEKIFAKLIAWYKKFFTVLVTVMGICVAVLLTLRAVDGELPEILNTLALLWDNGKEVVETSFTKNSVNLLKSIGWRPLVDLWNNFCGIFKMLGVHLVAMLFNFIEIFPTIGRNLLSFLQWILFLVIRVKDCVVLLFSRIIGIIMQIVESIVQFIEKIGV